jgi:hypothetical protein
MEAASSDPADVSVSSTNPGKALLIGVGVVCALLVLFLIIEGPGY